jgi:hypothetical protein
MTTGLDQVSAVRVRLTYRAYVISSVGAEDLTAVEQSLIDHVTRGDMFDLTAVGEAIDEAAMRSWDNSRTIRAWVLRDIMRGQLARDPDPHGLRLLLGRISAGGSDGEPLPFSPPRRDPSARPLARGSGFSLRRAGRGGPTIAVGG